MSIVTTATHTRPGNYRAHLRDAVAVMTLAGIEGRLAAARDPKSPRGRKRRYGAYTAFGFACVHYEMVASRLPVSFATMYERLWFDYTQEDLELIGLGDLRTPERLAQLQRPDVGAAEFAFYLNELNDLDDLNDLELGDGLDVEATHQATGSLDDLDSTGELDAPDDLHSADNLDDATPAHQEPSTYEPDADT